ncbi:hypothetical protein CspeluHIS016_0800820 [Cutaneotrichosporon spelunceum]|uniref:Uncharacterized protein n=1 Tax=Cutaneotrichosporon spelunceum TaxID=1672016 RepID=A0AAD3TZL2_9TREE|nr:hypothetical protein CspeluHIS016_0800820 [Cutaneotrichosporon spelunceum]
MARETRGSAAARGAASHPNQSPDLGSKRKRRTPEASASTDTNGETPDSKRVRTNGEVEPFEEESGSARPGRLLTGEIREAIGVVVSQMASGLPHPINGILTLALPPDFSQKEENTLGWILRQDTLTWEKLVSIIHLFAEHLLLPASYPNPIPSLDRFHLPVPPLPSHFAPMAVYTFCRGLHALLLQVEEQIDGTAVDVKPTERWALMQKTPGHGLGTAGGDWFTSAADLREVEAARKRLNVKNGETLLSNLAAGDKKFGAAQPLVVQATEPLGLGKGKVPSLSESLIRRASLKAQRWKESHAARRRSGFGGVLHEVTPVIQSTGWTPTFGPSYDSTNAQGLGYYSTLDLMHERRRRHLHNEVTAKIIAIDEDDGWYGTLGAVNDKENKPVETDNSDATNGKKMDDANEDTDAVLSANAERIDELQKWQEVRVLRGDSEWVSERERAVADELFASLARLVETSDTPPSAFLPVQTNSEKTGAEKKQSMGLAHKLARRLLANRAPIIRGTLDPRRPQALHDNVTLRLRAQTAAAITAPSPHSINGAPHALPPKSGSATPGFMPPPSSTIREPPPHTMPNNINMPRFYPQARSPYPTPQQQLQKSPHQSHQPLTPQQHHQALPQHQGMQHASMQQHHAMQQAMQAQQAMQMGLQLSGHQMPMVAGGSPAHAHMRMMGMMQQGVPQGMSQGGMQAGMQGMQMPQQFAHGSPQQQMFRPQAGMIHPQQQQMQFRPMSGISSPSPGGMAYPQQRMMAVPGGMRQQYAMPAATGPAPGTPGTSGAMGAMPIQMYQQGYGSPMPGRVGIPGGAVPMMGQMQGIPGQQVIHR